MDQRNETIRLNGLSRMIIAATVALGLGVAICAAPGEVSAFGRIKASDPVVLKTLSDPPGIALTRAYGAAEDCISVKVRGAVRHVCEH